MTNTATGWIIGMAAIGAMAAAIGQEVTALSSWTDAVTPAFVGKGMMHLGAVVAAFVGGKLIPTR